MQSPRARDVATLRRFALKRKSIPRGASSGVDVVREHDHDRRLLALELVHGADAHVAQRGRQGGHLRVVRRDDHEVGARERRLGARSVPPDNVAARERRRDRRDGLDLLLRARLVAFVLDGHVHEPGVSEALGRAAAYRDQGLALEPGRGVEAILVERLGRERADLRMQPASLMQEEAAFGRDRLCAAEQMLERGRLRAGRVARLLRLLELLRVAEQHEALRRGGQREHVGERHLSRLVDEQHVDAVAKLGPRPEPCRTAEQRVIAVQEEIRDPRIRVDRVDRLGVAVLGIAPVQALEPAELLLLGELADGAE